MLSRDPDLLTDENLLGVASLWGQLAGMVMLSLGGGGLLVRRALGASLERLGLRTPRPRALFVVVAGFVVLFAMNGGAETLQRRFFPDLWEADQRVHLLLASRLSPGHAPVL